MNNEIKTEKTTNQMSQKEFDQTLEKLERSDPFVDEALKKFSEKPEESNLFTKIKQSIDFILLIFLLSVLCVCSVINYTKGWIKPFISILTIICIVIVIKYAKKYK